MPFDPTRSGPQFDYLQSIVERGRIFARGFALVLVDLRGFGASGGCWDFGGPGEQADVKAAVEWAASRPWSNGRVGMVGNSYPGWTGAMGLAGRPRGLKAVAISAAPVSTALLMAYNGVHYGPDYFAPIVWGSANAQPGTMSDSADYHAAWAAGLDPRCTIVGEPDTIGTDPSSSFYRARDLRARLRGVKVPLLYAHGFLDTGPNPNMFMEWIPRVAGSHRMWLGQWDHGSPLPERSGRDGWIDQMVRLFERELAGRAAREPAPPVVVQEGPSGRFRGERRWPPTDVRITSLRLLPGTYMDVHGNSGEELQPTQSPSSLLGIHGIGTWTFSRPLTKEAHLSGVPKLRLQAQGQPRAVVVALLYDVAPGGSALLVSRGASRLDSNGRASFALFPQDWRFAKGHRFGLLLSGGDGEFWLPLDRTLGPVNVTGGALVLPLIAHVRNRFIAGERAPALAAKKPIQIDPATIDRSTAT